MVAIAQAETYITVTVVNLPLNPFFLSNLRYDGISGSALDFPAS
jgi:hypothetical protein